MKKRTIVIICVIIAAVIIFFLARSALSEASSIGIIGGADGPTAMFIAGEYGGSFLLILGMLIGFGAVRLFGKKNP